MGSRGPRPEPSYIKLLKGNPGKRPAGPIGPQPPDYDSSQPPDWLEGGERVVWERHAPELHRLGLLTALDVNAFSRYCCLVDMWNKLSRTIDETGLTYEVHKFDKLGEICGTLHRVRPEVGIMTRLNSDLLRLEREFGLTPAARPSLPVATPWWENNDDPFAVD